MANTIHVDVVSAEESIFSGEARFVALPGEAGELGVYPRHTPLITRIKPGSVRIEMADGSEEFDFVGGGILVVQPHCVTVLSGPAVRGQGAGQRGGRAHQRLSDTGPAATQLAPEQRQAERHPRPGAAALADRRGAHAP